MSGFALLEVGPEAREPQTQADPGLQPIAPLTTATTALPAQVTRQLVGGTSALTLGIFIERGCSFLANILAARFAGAQVFGAYSLAISTANNISTYAAGGIGATAARFSGKYPHGTAGYTTLARALSVVSLLSAALAAFGLWFGAAPIASLLHRPDLTGLLRWAAVSASGIILLECARGFFVGQRRLTAIVLLSSIVGAGMLTLLPAAAHRHSPIQMITFQGGVTTTAVVLCLLLAGPLRLRSAATVSLPLWPMLKEVWGFGLVQLAGLVGSSLAGWWITTLVVRNDTSLVQMSFFAIASQLRNIAGIAPSLLTEGSYAVMADTDESSRTPHRVMALCTFASVTTALMLAALGIVFIPWMLALFYGHTYAPAGITVAFALAVAVVHMGNAPAAARLTIVSIRSTGVINTVWAGFVALAATSLLLHPRSTWSLGGAPTAMAIYFAGHVVSSALVLLTLKRKDHVPAGMASLFLLTSSAAIILASLALLRTYTSPLLLTGVMFLLSLLFLAALMRLAKRFDWLPSASSVRSAVASILHSPALRPPEDQPGAEPCLSSCCSSPPPSP